MTAAIILIIVGILLTGYGIFLAINLAVQCWWLLCQICFKKLEKISYDIPVWYRWQMALSFVTGLVVIAVGFRLIP